MMSFRVEIDNDPKKELIKINKMEDWLRAIASVTGTNKSLLKPHNFPPVQNSVLLI